MMVNEADIDPKDSKNPSGLVLQLCYNAFRYLLASNHLNERFLAKTSTP